MVELDDEILQDFLMESKENIEKLDEKLIELEQKPDDKELLSSIFRVMHTLKGTCGFLGFTTLQAISHTAEEILSKLRDGLATADQETIDILLDATDHIKTIIAFIEKQKKEPDELAYKEFIKRMKEFADKLGKIDQKEDVENRCAEDIEEKAHLFHSVETHIRVDVNLLDKLMNLAGELVLSRNRLVQMANAVNDPELISATQRLSLVTTELQEEIMKTRMQPIGTVFNKFPRIVRDLSKSANKKVRLSIEGADTELDRSIIEAIKDPLVHIIRNAIDHGIESVEDRIRARKPAVGHVSLKAYHEGGQVIIEVEDDGAGIDTEKVKKKALENGLITQEEASRLSEKELVNLILRSGFSTAEKVTNISGRGVGMDVVKNNVEKLGGSIDIRSSKGKGTTIRLKIPLTLAIIPALIVNCRGQRYAIPQISLKELVVINKSDINRNIKVIGNSKFYRLRNEVIPIFYLEEVLGLPVKKKAQRVNIVVLNSGSAQFGLIVDNIWDSEEIVVKPIGKHLQAIPVYAGATLMGDGGIALILDVAGISSVLDIKKEEVSSTKRRTKGSKRKEESQFFLIFQISDHGEYFAIPLALVARLDKVRAEDIELVGGKEVIQYKGRSMPLIRLDQFMPVSPLSEKEEYKVIVFRIVGREVAFLASKIVDSIHAYFELDEELYQLDGIIGSAIVRKNTTLFVDVYKIIESYSPEWFRGYQAPRAYNILLAEDSTFYRNLIKSYLLTFGYHVITAKDGKEAWDKVQEHETDLLLTDIVMPGMDGLELSLRIRQDERLKHLPIIAVSSYYSEEDIRRWQDAGIDDYIPKLELERLVGVIEETLKERLKKVA